MMPLFSPTQRLALLLALAPLLPSPFLAIATPSTAENAWKDDAALHDLFFVDREWGWAVGDHGTIWRSQDGGQTWELQSTPCNDALHAVSFVDRQVGFAAGGAPLPADAGGGSRGVVLATRDGGATWDALTTHVPALRRLQFFSADVGVAAGLGSASHPAGVYTTTSGGRGWQPVGGGRRQAWLATDFLDRSTGVLAGVGGRVGQIEAGSYAAREPLDPAGRSLRDLALAPPLGGWLVGDGGLVFATSDLGRSWQQVDSLPASFLAHADLLCVATFESHVWIAGSPGSVVLHSPDAGRTWERQLTGALTPMRRLRFVDSACGWAVGDLGVILCTRDGGATWQISRGAQRRAAALAVVASSSDLACETLSGIAADEGYRTVVHAWTDPQAAAATGAVEASAFWEEGARRLGCHAATMAWQFPAPSRRLALAPAEMFQAIDQRNDGRAAERMRADLVRQIRMWRPELVLLPDPHAESDASSSRPLDSALHAIALEAIAEAGDATTHIRLATEWRLPAWRAARVMASLPPGARGTHHIDVQQLGRRLKEPLFDLAAPGRALVERINDDNQALSDRAEATQEFLFVSGSPPSKTDDLMSGLSIAAGGPARRDWQPIAEVDDPRRALRLAQQRRNLRRLLQSSAANPAWLAQANDMVGELDAGAGASLLNELADGFSQLGHVAMAAEARQMLVSRYPDHSAADAALRWLVQFYASGETAHAYAGGATPMRPSADLDAASADASGVRLASAESPTAEGPPTTPLSANFSREERLEQATQWVAFAAQSRPLLADDPALRFPWIAAQRSRGFAASAERHLLGWEHRDHDNPWQACAAAERWLRQPDDKPPALPIATCRQTARRPQLDGQLDEPMWQTQHAARLRNVDDGSDVGPAQVRLAYDAEYLYIAVTSPGAPGIGYQVDDRPRRHDEPLEAHDRIRLLFDIDRDYVTWYELDVDARGFTGDRCFGDALWNPEWFVAAAVETGDSTKEGASSTLWQIEAAVAWRELVDAPPQSRDVWTMSLERIIPAVGFQTWTGPAAASPGPENFGLLIFE